MSGRRRWIERAERAHSRSNTDTRAESDGRCPRVKPEWLEIAIAGARARCDTGTMNANEDEEEL